MAETPTETHVLTETRVLIESIRDAITAKVRDHRIEESPGGLTAISFVHPIHEATVLIVAEPANAKTPTAAVTTLVVVADWADVKDDAEAVLRFFGLNTRLMSCAVALAPLNADEVSVVLARRVPATDYVTSETLEWVEHMAYEYVKVAGYLDQDATTGGTDAVH